VIGNWRWIALIFAFAIVAATILTGVQPSAHADEHEANWEVWALDQGEGLNRIHVFDQNLEETARIDFGELDAPHNTVQTPHMIDFDATNQFAVVASTASGTVSIIRTADYEVLDTIETGATAHMASFTPNNSAIWVANIGAQTLTRIDVDIDNDDTVDYVVRVATPTCVSAKAIELQFCFQTAGVLCAGEMRHDPHRPHRRACMQSGMCRLQLFRPEEITFPKRGDDGRGDVLGPLEHGGGGGVTFIGRSFSNVNSAGSHR
jgi:hypothetical protein